MAEVRNIGATAGLRAPADRVTDDPDFASVAVRLFARLDDGTQVDDPEDSVSVRLERTKLAAVELSVQMSLRLKQTPTGVRRDAWERICAELAGHGIDAAPEDLHVLRFEFAPNERLRREMTQSWDAQQPGPPGR
ncbi:MAG: hypothetical protein QOG15_1794 [Solirubrobacteraceae bacterium]|jgi:hypothetical protein|nr:hypothetical protein [Solirubrobacteraceae bacterium]